MKFAHVAPSLLAVSLPVSLPVSAEAVVQVLSLGDFTKYIGYLQANELHGDLKVLYRLP